MYKLCPLNDGKQLSVEKALHKMFIPFDPANTDYANFKAQILSGEAELQDADGNLMTPQDAKDFVRTLP